MSAVGAAFALLAMAAASSSSSSPAFPYIRGTLKVLMGSPGRGRHQNFVRQSFLPTLQQERRGADDDDDDDDDMMMTTIHGMSSDDGADVNEEKKRHDITQALDTNR